MNTEQIAEKLKISKDFALKVSKELLDLGSLIDIQKMNLRLCTLGLRLLICTEDFAKEKILNLKEIKLLIV